MDSQSLMPINFPLETYALNLGTDRIDHGPDTPGHEAFAAQAQEIVAHTCVMSLQENVTASLSVTKTVLSYTTVTFLSPCGKTPREEMGSEIEGYNALQKRSG